MLQDLENEVNKGRLAFGDYAQLTDTIFIYVNDTHQLIAQISIRIISSLAKNLKATYKEQALVAIPVVFKQFTKFPDDILACMDNIMNCGVTF